MASDYRAATGSGIALGSLTVLVPQPRTDATVQPVLRTEAVSGAVHEQGLFIDLLWSMLATPTEYTTLLGVFGLTSVLYANVTVYVPNASFSYARYNGIAIKPLMGTDIRRTDYYIRDVVVRIKNLVAL